MTRLAASLTIVAASLAIASCGSADGNEAMGGSLLTWSKLPDGSSYAISAKANGDREVTRCWPGATRYACLSAAKFMAVTHRNVTVRMHYEDALPSNEPVYVAAPHDGYSCRFANAAEPVEEIIRDGHPLTTSTSRWSPSHVQQYIADNHVSGGGYFPCLKVLEAMRSGSVDTLGTTSIDKSMVGMT